MKHLGNIAVRSLLIGVLAACNNDEQPQTKTGHVHTHADDAKFGGAMVEIGAHAAWVEIVHEPGSGLITTYIRDAHAVHPLPCAMKRLPLTVLVNGKEHEIELLPYIDPLSSEKAGAVSVFRARIEVLKGVTTFSGALGKLALRGKIFPPATFTYPAK